jgi:tetratricopeptide (TPR) repeat protein
MTMYGMAESLIRALYERNIEQAAEIGKKLLTLLEKSLGRESGGNDYPFVADAIGRMLARNCMGQHYHSKDCGFERIREPLEQHMPPLGRRTLSQAAHWEMFEGLYTYHQGDYDKAYEYFDRVKFYGDSLKDPDLEPISRLYLGRCARKMGDVHEALRHYSNAQDKLEIHSHNKSLIGVIEVLKVSEYFQQGLSASELHEKLNKAAVCLNKKDYSTLGHIGRIRGRIFMREGKYREAIPHLKGSIKGYQRREKNHRGVARVLTNLARAQMLLASDKKSNLPMKEKIQLWRTATSSLDAAEETYRNSHDPSSRPEIDTLRAELEYEQNHIDKALDSARRAYREAFKNFERQPSRRPLCGDISTARIIECKCHLKKATHAQERGNSADATESLKQAKSAAEEAGQYAEKLGHKRRIARATVWKGRVKAAWPGLHIGYALDDLEAAKALLPQNDLGYIRSELDELEQLCKDATQEDPEHVLYSVTVGTVLSNKITIASEEGLKKLFRDVEDKIISYLEKKEILSERGLAKKIGVGRKKAAAMKKRHAMSMALPGGAAGNSGSS